MQLAAVGCESGAGRPLHRHVAVRIPIRTADQGNAKQAHRDKEPPVTAEPYELGTFEDRPEFVVEIHDRKGGLDLLDAAGAGLQQHRIEIGFAGAKLESVVTLQRKSALLLHQIRIQFLRVGIDALDVGVDTLDVGIVELDVGVDALEIWIDPLQVWIRGMKISILLLRECRLADVDVHLRSRARRCHAGRDVLYRGDALDWSGALHDDRLVRLLRLRIGDGWNGGHRRQYHGSSNACCRWSC